MSKFIVMDLVFYSGSLNYDQGAGNYQELKKITKWDGRQYTLVSRYALRYSILEYANKLGIWKIADADLLEKDGDVIQPSPEKLINGELLKYPEFDLFGYLVTSTEPQNNKEAAVKISHAISLTPFNYDNHFCANVGLASRMKKKYGELTPNPFTIEENYTYYCYTVVIHVDDIGKMEIYLVNKDKKNTIVEDGNELKIKFKGSSEDIVINNYKKINDKVYKIEYELGYGEKKKRITDLIKILLNLKRNIKGKEEDLSPKILVLGLYENTPYQTYKDKIILNEEEYDETIKEVIKEEQDGKVIERIIYKVCRSKIPKFTVYGNNLTVEELNKDKIIKDVEEWLNKNNDNYSKTIVYYSKDVKVELK